MCQNCHGPNSVITGKAWALKFVQLWRSTATDLFHIWQASEELRHVHNHLLLSTESTKTLMRRREGELWHLPFNFPIFPLRLHLNSPAERTHFTPTLHSQEVQILKNIHLHKLSWVTLITFGMYLFRSGASWCPVMIQIRFQTVFTVHIRCFLHLYRTYTSVYASVHLHLFSISTPLSYLHLSCPLCVSFLIAYKPVWRWPLSWHLIHFLLSVRRKCW